MFALLSGEDAVLVNEGLRVVGAKVVSYGTHNANAHRFVTGSFCAGVGGIFASSLEAGVGNCTIDEICLGRVSAAPPRLVQSGSEWPFRLGYVLARSMSGGSSDVPASVLQEGWYRFPFDTDLVSVVSKI
ncbi:hypothetical protein AS156_18580 [Bradyrhizobium macuxiense]|uniref:Uncharacterized protein n=1 Tax=Bradyrhizobium macuxiense TaxID=1755647 RepID=A0A109JGC3_9BRAD|nr:hypothetical protein AS156_18580 [Bradyrhizobium macuxiense]